VIGNHDFAQRNPNPKLRLNAVIDRRIELIIPGLKSEGGSDCV
jgi:hypothetical protein